MRFNTLLNELILLIKNDSYFKDIKVKYSYPSRVKPTRLSRSYITLGINSAEIIPAYVDSDDKTASITVFADIFVPEKSGSEKNSEIFMNLCRVFMNTGITGISAGRISYDKNVQAFLLETSISFNGLLEREELELE